METVFVNNAAKKVARMIGEHTDKIKAAIADESKPPANRNQEMTFSIGYLYGVIALLETEELVTISEADRSSLRDEAVKSTHIVGVWADAYRKLQANEALSDNSMPSPASKLN